MQQKKSTSMLLLAVLLAVSMLPVATPAAQAQSACADDVLVRAGDTLSAIAQRELGSYGAYTRIVTATNAAAESDDSYATIANPGVIEVGWKLCIPVAATTGTSAPVDAGGSSEPADAPADDDETFDFDGELLTIDYLRSLEFPAGDLTIVEELDAGDNYSRYVASYESDGLTIDGLLTVPNGTPPESGWPAIIFNHGYIPPEIYRTTERYVAYQDGFARNGYVTFKSDYRGHGFSEGESRSAYGTPDYTIDVLNATATIKALDYVDPDRIGMWGHSMGGYITVRAMLADPDIKAGVIWAGVVASYPDIISRWTRTNSIPASIPNRARRWREQLQDEYGTPEENPEFWASISANSYVDELSGPIQLHHGTADGDVPILFSELLYDEIQAAGGDAELYSYQGDNHNLSQQFNTAMSRSVAFFDQNLKE